MRSGLAAAASVALALATASHASTGAPDAFGYTWADPASGCVAEVPPFGAGAITSIATTGMIGPVSLPWPWRWLDRTVTNVWISPTGYVTFSDQGPAVSAPQALPSATVPNDLIAALWFGAIDADISHEGTANEFHVRWSQRTGTGPTALRTLVDLVLLPGGRYVLSWPDGGGVSFATVGHEDSGGTRGRTMYRNLISREPGFPTPVGGASACVQPPAAIDCSLASAVSCGELRRVTFGPTPGARVYSCASPDLPAGEAVVRVDLAEYAILDLTASDPTAWLLELRAAPPCDEWHCLRAAQRSLVFAATPGSHVFALDSPTAVPGSSVDLQVTCRPLGAPLSCGDNVSGDTLLGTTMFNERTCTLDDMGGREDLYRITLAAATLLELEVEGGSPDLWVQVHGAAGFATNGGDCKGARRGSLALPLPAGDYIVVIDGRVGSESAYTLHARCGSGSLTCVGAPALSCGVPAAGRTIAPGQCHAYSCDRGASLGGEATWRFHNPLEQTVDFSLVGGDARLQVAVLSGCDPTACLTRSHHPVIRALPAGDYVVVVDGPIGSESAFQLLAQCADIGMGGADLRVTEMDSSAASTQCVGLAVSGIARVTVTNAGDIDVPTATSLVVFEDRDGNGRYDGPVVDELVGTGIVSALPTLASVSLDVALSGVLRFRDAPLWAECDSSAAWLETDETNNGRSSSSACSSPAAQVFDPVLEWEWTSTSVAPDFLSVASLPLVGDVSGDGVPDVVIATKVAIQNSGEAMLRALSGRDGSELWTASDPALRVRGWSQAALVDLDGDGRADIVAQSEVDPTRVLAISSAGTFMWRSAPVIGVLDDFGMGGPTVFDLDGDGRPEIAWGAEVLAADGSRYWSAEPGGTIGTVGASEHSISVAADVLGDARAEVIAGPTAYTDDGSGVGRIAWRAAGVPDGFTAIGDLDQDGAPEVVVAAEGQVFLLDAATGAVRWAVTLPVGDSTCPGQTARGGPPVIADFDGDHRPDIGLAAAPNMLVLDGDGNMKWQADLASCNALTSPTAFDFQGDGRTEVVFIAGGLGASAVVNVLDGRDGALLLTLPGSRRSSMEAAVVADVDGDDNAEIVVPLADVAGGVRVYGDRGDGWVRARPVWNENAYHITNISEQCEVPPTEQESWLASNTYRTQLSDDGTALPDLTMAILSSDVRLTPTCQRELVVTCRIGNAGKARAGAAFTGSVYDGDPLSGGVLLTMVSIGDLLPGEFRDIVAVMPLSGLGMREIHAFADGDGVLPESVRECREDNNSCVLLVDNPPEGVHLPADVGAALRVTDHGDPRAASISARLSWLGDEGAPRTGEHFHLLRGDRPDALGFQTSLEQLAATELIDVTSAVPGRTCHYYIVLAADPCEQESRL